MVYSALYCSLLACSGLSWSLVVCPGLHWSGLYLGAIEEQQHVLQRPPLFGQLFPQGVDGGRLGGRIQVQVKGGGAGQLVDGTVGEEAGRTRFLE